MGRGRIAMVVVGCFVALLALALPARAIVGGSPSSTATYPFMASVQSNGSHFCGGSVVTSRWVLTAAHCVPDGKAAGLTVVIGRTTLSRPGGVRHAVVQVVVHGGYKEGAGNDVALLRLATPTGAPPITLATGAHNSYERAGTMLRVTGWGDTTPLAGGGLLTSDGLRQVDVPVVADAECGANATELCAGEALKDSCQGDSGGPLFATIGRTRVQMGIVSNGVGCGVPGFPGYYTEINATPIRAFIKYVTGR